MKGQCLVTMPVQKPGKSVQAVQTPPEFIAAVKNLLGIHQFKWDLAASIENAYAPTWFTENVDSLEQCWSNIDGWCWLNPPYADIKPWVRKAFEECVIGAKIAMLVPASVGANWWRDYVDSRASVWFLNGRLTFMGHKSPYPKDLALLIYAIPTMPGYKVWQWKKYLTQTHGV